MSNTFGSISLKIAIFVKVFDPFRLRFEWCIIMPSRGLLASSIVLLKFNFGKTIITYKTVLWKQISTTRTAKHKTNLSSEGLLFKSIFSWKSDWNAISDFLDYEANKWTLRPQQIVVLLRAFFHTKYSFKFMNIYNQMWTSCCYLDPIFNNQQSSQLSYEELNSSSKQ